MSREKKNGKRESGEVPSYMKETLSSLRKNRERVSSSCTPRRMSCGLRSSSKCLDDNVRPERGSSVGPVRKTAAVSSVESDVPRYMKPTRSSSQKGVGDKYQIRPPRPPSALSDAGSSPTARMDVKKAEQRIQRSSGAVSPFVGTLRGSDGGSDISEASAVMNNSMELTGGKGSRVRCTRSNSDVQKKVTAVRDRKDALKGRTRESPTPRFMQPTTLSALRSYTN